MQKDIVNLMFFNIIINVVAREFKVLTLFNRINIFYIDDRLIVDKNFN